MQIHSVNSEGLQRLLMLMEGSHWLNNNNSRNNDYKTFFATTDCIAVIYVYIVVLD